MTFPDMRVLFIGGTGNISADCATLLHEQGHEVFVLTRGRVECPPGCKHVLADRNLPGQMRAAVAGTRPDIVLNFLGYELVDVQNDHEIFRDRIRQYIFISSATVYRKPPSRLPITEDEPLENPWWDYAQKKILCEQWLMDRWRESGFPVTIVRPSHTYSDLWVPNGVSSSSYTFAARLEQGKPVYLHDNGETLWTLTASPDFALGLAGLIGNERAIGLPLHITSDEALTWNEIYRIIAEQLGAPPPNIVHVPTDFICKVAPQFTGTLKGDKAHPGVFDNTRVKELVPGFTCRVPFREGVRRSIDFLRRNPDRKNLKPELDTLIDRILAGWRAENAD